jgi:hypothetical protein
MLNFRVQFARNILDQCAPEEDIEALIAVANREDGFVFRESVFEKREIGALAIGIGVSGCRVAASVVELGIYVRGAARENEGVERTLEPLQIVRSERQGDLYRLSACLADRLQVFVVLRAIARKFFFSSAVRDTDARFLGCIGSHESNILPSLAEASNLDAKYRQSGARCDRGRLRMTIFQSRPGTPLRVTGSTTGRV